MTRAHTATVAVTRAGDLIRIDPGRRPRDLLGSALDVPGGQLIFDVEAPTAPPTAEVTDADAAARWIVRVYGTEALDAVRARDADEQDEATTTQITVAPSPEGERLARIALGQWLWRFWPDSPETHPLNTALLRIELAALAWAADDSFGALQPAGLFLRGQLDALEQAADALHARMLDEPSVVGTSLGRAVLGAVDALVVGEAALAADAPSGLLERLDAVLDAATRIKSSLDGAGAISVDRPADSAVLAGATREDFALAASAPDDANRQSAPGALEGVDSVDWTQVPPRVLDWREHTVRWTLTAAGGGRWTISVRVAAAADAESDELYARCYLLGGAPEDLLPVLVLPLVAGLGEYLGDAELAIADPSQLVVDVFAESSVHRPRVTEESRAEGADDRERARDVIRRRATSAGDGPADLFEAERPQP